MSKVYEEGLPIQSRCLAVTNRGRQCISKARLDSFYCGRHSCGRREMKHTGVKATPEETVNIQELAKVAQKTPMIAFSSADALSGDDMASQAWKRVHEALQKAALAHGLPEIPGYYGMTEDGEFVTV